MKTSKLRMVVMLCTIIMLSVIAYVLYTYPSLLGMLPWPDEPSVPAVSEDPKDTPSNASPDTPTIPPSDDPSEVPSDETTDDPFDAPSDEPPVSEPQEPFLPIVTLSGSYYTYAQMKEQLFLLAERYSDIFQVSSYGTSLDGRRLYAATLGDPNASKQIVITAGMHSREYVNCFVVMRQIEYYLEHYDVGSYGGKSFRDLFSEVCLVIVPMTNPDGITLAQEGVNALHSETLREEIGRIVRSLSNSSIDLYLNLNWKTNARGVDINRNFDTRWDEYVVYDSNGKINSRYLVPSFKEYKGNAPESEPETTALAELTRKLSNPVASVCVHSQGNIIYWRCDQTGAFEAENKRLAEIARSITGYTIIDENQTEPSYSNWTVLALDIPTITIENGIGGYPQSYDMADGFYACNRDLWAAIALEYADVAARE